MTASICSVLPQMALSVPHLRSYITSNYNSGADTMDDDKVQAVFAKIAFALISDVYNPGDFKEVHDMVQGSQFPTDANLYTIINKYKARYQGLPESIINGLIILTICNAEPNINAFGSFAKMLPILKHWKVVSPDASADNIDLIMFDVLHAEIVSELRDVEISDAPCQQKGWAN